MSSIEVGALMIAGVVAGMMNAVAGGGTILTFPALLAFGMPAIAANATSTLALVVGILGSAFGYRSHMTAIRPWLARFGVVSLAGGLLGAWLLTVTSEEAFSRLVPFLLLLATMLFMAQGPVKRWIGRPHEARAAGLSSMAAQFFVSVYGGYFGAGIGILMLAVFGFMGFQSIHRMNALKTVLAAVINLAASVYFASSGLIKWPQAFVLTMGATAGYFAGAHYSQKIPEIWVRRVITTIGLGLSGIFFWRQFAG
ncbi:MAG: sulfite exporter TauE/SafE family protein [Terrimicrobiaceae bacterium]